MVDEKKGRGRPKKSMSDEVSDLQAELDGNFVENSAVVQEPVHPIGKKMHTIVRHCYDGTMDMSELSTGFSTFPAVDDYVSSWLENGWELFNVSVLGSGKGLVQVMYVLVSA